jgi:hypothetical protein
MKIQTVHCPTCGKLAHGIIEHCECLAFLNCEDNGDAEYEGYTEYFSENQELPLQLPVRNNNLVTLRCIDGHEWQSGMTE